MIGKDCIDIVFIYKPMVLAIDTCCLQCGCCRYFKKLESETLEESHDGDVMDEVL